MGPNYTFFYFNKLKKNNLLKIGTNLKQSEVEMKMLKKTLLQER